jgi:hypothetical protein
VRKANDVSVLCLEDRGIGMSLTNGMEDVIEELQLVFKKEGKPFPSLVIYKDTDGMWDGWDIEKEEFILLQFKRCEKALNEITIKK